MVSRPEGAIAAEAFAAPISDTRHLPLRIAVYDAIAHAVRTGSLLPSQLLPPEADLGTAFGVSRTVMREALILLEEDGLIRTKRGVGRFIVDVIPRIGIEQLRPIEEVLGLPDQTIKVERLRAEITELTDFTMRGLGCQPDARARVWESLLLGDGEKIALLQEWVVANSGVPEFPDVHGILDARQNDGTSMLSALMSGLHESLGPATCEVSVSTAGAHRAHMLGVTNAGPVVLMAQSVWFRSAPLMVAKYLVRPEHAHFTIIQS